MKNGAAAFVPKLLADALGAKPAVTGSPTMTPEDRERIAFVQNMVGYCDLKLRESREGQALLAAQKALATCEGELSAKYGVALPFTIQEDGTITPQS